MRKPRDIKTVIERVIKQLGCEHQVRENEIMSYWGEIVGDEIKKHTKPQRISYGKLWVNVDSSVWLNELEVYSKKTILENLQKKMGKKIIKNIKFQIGKVD